MRQYNNSESINQSVILTNHQWNLVRLMHTALGLKRVSPFAGQFHERSRHGFISRAFELDHTVEQLIHPGPIVSPAAVLARDYRSGVLAAAVLFIVRVCLHRLILRSCVFPTVAAFIVRQIVHIISILQRSKDRRHGLSGLRRWTSCPDMQKQEGKKLDQFQW